MVRYNPYVLNGNYELQKFIWNLTRQYKFDLIIETGSHQERLIPFFIELNIEIWAIEQDIDAYLENTNELEYIKNIKYINGTLEECLYEIEKYENYKHTNYLIIEN